MSITVYTLTDRIDAIELELKKLSSTLAVLKNQLQEHILDELASEEDDEVL